MGKNGTPVQRRGFKIFVQGELQSEYIGIKLYDDKHARDMKGCIIIKFCSMNRISSQTKNRKKESGWFELLKVLSKFM